jgi:hypothetical protein
LKQRAGASGLTIPFELKPVSLFESGASTCFVDWQAASTGTGTNTKSGGKPSKALAIFLEALHNMLADQGFRTRPFADGPEVTAVDREAVRNEFLKTYPADNLDAKGEAFRRSEKNAVAGGFLFSRQIGERTLFWAAQEG